MNKNIRKKIFSRLKLWKNKNLRGFWHKQFRELQLQFELVMQATLESIEVQAGFPLGLLAHYPV